MVTPFAIPNDAGMIADLRDRLANVRWADAVTADWSMGTERSFLKHFADHWRDSYDWNERLEHLNRLPHYRATVDGCSLHLLHYKAGTSAAIPLLLMNGWPSSFVEYQRLAPLLATGSPQFDVIIPAVPGFGFSDRPTQAYQFEPADLYPKLMTLLGYKRFMVAGTDIGSGIATRIALRHPERVLALHVSAVAPKPKRTGEAPPSSAETAYSQDLLSWSRDEGGYQVLQSSKPQTLAFGLADSPIGLASWIIEKFHGWTDHDGDLLSTWPVDDLIDNVMIYWMTNTIGSSVRYYYEGSRLRPPLNSNDYVHVPTAVAVWPRDLAQPPRELAERLYEVRRYTRMARGGHFPAWEAPDLYAEDLRAHAIECVVASRRTSNGIVPR